MFSIEWYNLGGGAHAKWGVRPWPKTLIQILNELMRNFADQNKRILFGQSAGGAAVNDVIILENKFSNYIFGCAPYLCPSLRKD